MLDRYFELSGQQTSFWTELSAGFATFLTMAYILVLNPLILTTIPGTGDPTGLDPAAVLLATGLAASLTTLAMGLYARLPIALAPGMGQNVLFATFVGVLINNNVGHAWQTALGVVFIAGVIFVLISISPIRQAIVNTLSPSLRHAITVGIGLFIAVLGLRNGHILSPGPEIRLGLAFENFYTPEVAIFVTGFVVTGSLYVWKIPGAILAGIVAATSAAWLTGQVMLPEQLLGLPEPQTGAVFALDIFGALQWLCLPFVVVFVFVDLFDTTGTLLGVGEQAGLVDQDGQLPRSQKAYLVDSAGTVVGACLGTSPVTSYIESAAGVEQGGRTGLTAVVVGLLFSVALAFSPLVLAIGQVQPVAAAGLVYVGAIMAGSVRLIAWDDPTEAVPAFLILLGIPVAFSITDGLALGLIAYPVLKLLGGRFGEKGLLSSLLSWALAAALVAYFLLLRQVH